MAESVESPGFHTFTKTFYCNDNNNSEDLRGLRISAIFVILVGSLLGALIPIIANSSPSRPQKIIFFIVKYFGSGVIVATAFIHLLAPANEALTNPCLDNSITKYPWAQGIALMSIFALFFVELFATSWATLTDSGDKRSHTHSHGHSDGESSSDSTRGHASLPGEDHLGHVRRHQDVDTAGESRETIALDILNDPSARARPENKPWDEEKALEAKEDYAAQLVSVWIFEFGVLFHSVIIGLTLAVTGENFKTLYIVLVFHQTFEGLALGTRLAIVKFSKARRLTPYAMAIAYGLSTPLAIAVGLAVRKTYTTNSNRVILVQGIFDSISAGILLYTGLIELMAHEFLFSETFRPVRRGMRRNLFAAYGCMVLGAGLMALLGLWA